jgi:hypothetical protein
MDELDRLIALVNGVFSSIELAVVCRDRPVMAEWKDKIELRYLRVSCQLLDLGILGDLRRLLLVVPFQSGSFGCFRLLMDCDQEIQSDPNS